MMMFHFAFTILFVLLIQAFALPAFGAGPPAAGNPAAAYTPVYLYPKAGQSLEQQDRDRYECHNWAVKQTGFDPFLRPAPQQYSNMAVVPVPPAGHDTAVLGFTGALVGALAAGPHNSGVGALAGGIAGAAIGAVSDSSRQEKAREIEDAYNRNGQVQNSQIQRRAYDYRRAMSACLEGRGYSVR